MKKFLLILIASMVVGISNCNGQDIIVKMDGTTIQSKVDEVGTSEVKYHKWNNLDGPAYVISIADIQYIQFSNGEKETFEKDNTNNEQIKENESSLRQQIQDESNYYHNQQYDYNYWAREKESLRLRGKGLQTAGIIVGVVGSLAGLGGAVWAGLDDEALWYIPVLGICAPLTITGIILIGVGGSKIRAANNIHLTHIYQHNFKIGNQYISTNLDILSSNMKKTKTLGLGLTYSF